MKNHRSLAQGSQRKTAAIVTFVSNPEQERAVKALIKSVRELGGTYRSSEIYVVTADANELPCASLRQEGVVVLALEMERAFLDYPLALKAFAAAQVEKKVADTVATLVWLDPGVMVLNSLAALDLDGEFSAAVRPVTLANTIAMPPQSEPDDYWKPIYEETGLDCKTLPLLETIADEVKIQPYYNCEVFSFNPGLGIAKEWARLLARFLKDENYQKTACTTFLKRLFLHQAVLSAVISSRAKPDRIKVLPLASGYPFNQHEKLSASKKAASLNDLSVAIFDYAWDRIPGWMEKVEIKEPLKEWLFDTYLDYLKLNDNLYRIEGSCNSYLVTTNDGSVLIDPAGASAAPQFFRRVLAAHPLKAILLTHAHQDHSDNIEKWKTSPDIPVIAQRKYREYFQYQAEFAEFFARRNAIWSAKPLAAPPPVGNDSRGEPIVFFADAYDFACGGFHFKMIHTPGETPDHTTIWIPELAAVFMGDNYYEYFINNSTFRGTMIRPMLGYIHALDLALTFAPEYFLMGHGAPLVAKQRIQKTAGDFRAALEYIYNETVKGINAGKDVFTLMREIKLPEKLAIPQYFGKVEWTVRGIWQE
ncbi:MAG: MBL fold metallo-hydrolase, partial [Candidatus Aminicenantes bacterium]|nr:MBL fold metallo-hydrolase [Candidatus Aminicenantes bacterium]